jgi:hypothetical protein
MGELRVSNSQPQAPAFQEAPEAPKAPAKGITSKAKAKASKAPQASPESKRNAKGQPFRCNVKMGASQCANPARWPHGSLTTCTTHHKALAKGASLKPYSSLKALYQAPAASKSA